MMDMRIKLFPVQTLESLFTRSRHKINIYVQTQIFKKILKQKINIVSFAVKTVENSFT